VFDHSLRTRTFRRTSFKCNSTQRNRPRLLYFIRHRKFVHLMWHLFATKIVTHFRLMSDLGRIQPANWYQSVRIRKISGPDTDGRHRKTLGNLFSSTPSVFYGSGSCQQRVFEPIACQLIGRLPRRRGLVIWSSVPACRQRSRSLIVAWAVSLFLTCQW
jgi:hypothetical protein